MSKKTTAEPTSQISTAFKFVIQPTKSQAEIMIATGQDAAHAYNWALRETEARTHYSQFRTEYMDKTAREQGFLLYDPEKIAARKRIVYSANPEDAGKRILTQEERKVFFNDNRANANSYASTESKKFRAKRELEIAEQGFRRDEKIQNKEGKWVYPSPQSDIHKIADSLLSTNWYSLAKYFTTRQKEDFAIRGARDFVTPRYSVLSGAENAAKAFNNMYEGRAKHPKFKNSRGTDISFKVPNSAITFHDGENFYHISIPPHKEIKQGNDKGIKVIQRNNFKKLRKLMVKHGKSIVNNAVISHKAGVWYMSVSVTYTPATLPFFTKRQQSNGDVGIDLGVTTLATLSNGIEIKRLQEKESHFKNSRVKKSEKYLESLSDGTEIERSQKKDSYPAKTKVTKSEKRIRTLKQGLNKMVGGRPGDTPSMRSNRYKKKAALIAKLQHKQTQARLTETHSITKNLVSTYQNISIETLNTSGMLRSPKPKPDPDNPGNFLPNNSAAKAGLSRGIQESGFYEMKRQLIYKTERYTGAEITQVSMTYASTQTCSKCGNVRTGKDKLPLSQRTYICLNNECGHTQGRDHNAAINILHEGKDNATRK